MLIPAPQDRAFKLHRRLLALAENVCVITVLAAFTRLFVAVGPTASIRAASLTIVKFEVHVVHASAVVVQAGVSLRRNRHEKKRHESRSGCVSSNLEH